MKSIADCNNEALYCIACEMTPCNKQKWHPLRPMYDCSRPDCPQQHLAPTNHAISCLGMAYINNQGVIYAALGLVYGIRARLVGGPARMIGCAAPNEASKALTPTSIRGFMSISSDIYQFIAAGYTRCNVCTAEYTLGPAAPARTLRPSNSVVQEAKSTEARLPPSSPTCLCMGRISHLAQYNLMRPLSASIGQDEISLRWNVQGALRGRLRLWLPQS